MAFIQKQKIHQRLKLNLKRKIEKFVIEVVEMHFVLIDSYSVSTIEAKDFILFLLLQWSIEHLDVGLMLNKTRRSEIVQYVFWTSYVHSF